LGKIKLCPPSNWRVRPGTAIRQRDSDRRQFQTINVGAFFFRSGRLDYRPSPSCNTWKVTMPERAILWEPLADVDFPCPRLDFEFTNSNDLNVAMRFSELNTGSEPRKPDLELRFSGVIGLRWAPEFHGSIIQPQVPSRPKCRDQSWQLWVLPVVVVQESTWLSQYMDLPGTENRQHFSIVCMEDLLDVIALAEAQVRWITNE
jgi:hypothetical protein